MAERPIVVLHFKDVSNDDRLRESIEKRCRELAGEFPEAARFELTLEPDGAGYCVHGHVTGKSTDVASQASASEVAPAADRLLRKVQRQLRRQHQKRIFAQRREAQRDPPKRKGR